MAGSYPDIPGPRILYERDGSVAYKINGGFIQAYSAAQLLQMNDEDHGDFTVGNPLSYFGVVFPEPRDLVGYYLVLTPTGGGGTYVPNGWTLGNMETSTNTTNGQDGTWTNRGAVTSLGVSTQIKPGYRSNIYSVGPWLGTTGIRFQISNDGFDDTRLTFHIYGGLSATATVDRLRFWDSVLDNELTGSYFDWGNAVRGTTADKQFRIRNNSSTLTANNITISTAAITDATPSIVPQITFSNGGAFSQTLNIGNLAPGGTSSVITARRTTLSNAELGLWTWRLLAEAGSWT